jgi:hypothetical protein
MPEEEKKKTKTELGKEERLAERADRKAASDGRKAKTAEKQTAIDDRLKYGTQRQIETSARMDRREFNSGLYLRGNDPMAGRRKPVKQVGTQGGGIDFTSTQINAIGGGGASEVSRLQITKKTPPFYSGDPPAANEFFVSAGLYNGSIPTNIENKFPITVAADTNFYFWLEVTLSSNNPAFATAIAINGGTTRPEIEEVNENVFPSTVYVVLGYVRKTVPSEGVEDWTIVNDGNGNVGAGVYPARYSTGSDGELFVFYGYSFQRYN